MDAQYRVKDQNQIEKIALLKNTIKEQKENMEWLFSIIHGQAEFSFDSKLFNLSGAAYTAQASDFGGTATAASTTEEATRMYVDQAYTA